MKGTPTVEPEEVTLDFNKYPTMWGPYQELPQAIRDIFDPYITELSNLEE